MKDIFDNVRLLLTTRGRVSFQPTLKNLSDTIRQKVTIICYPGERKQHLINWEGKVYQIIEHPNVLDNIDAIRHWCIEHFKEDYIIFMDDNLNFHVRKDSERGTQCKFPLHQMCSKHFSEKTISTIQWEMFTWIIDRLKSMKYGIVGSSSSNKSIQNLIDQKYGVVGISTRPGNNRHIKNEEENFRVYAFWGINKLLFNQVKYNYDVSSFKYKGDFYTVLFMLTQGFPNIISYKYSFGKVGGPNNQGGCSIYRNEKLISLEAELLAKKFPGIVKIVTKNSKSWKGVSDEIKDVNVQWKKAYEYGIRQKKDEKYRLF